MTRRTTVIGTSFALVVALAPILSAGEGGGEFVPPEDLAEGWYARVETSRGRIVARLHPEQAPQAVAYFAALAEGRLEWFDLVTGEAKKSRYYDGIPIHWAVAGELFGAGAVQANGDHSPDLFVPPEGFGPIDFSRPGRFGMKRSTGRISGVEFFVTASAVTWFNGVHPCFATVVSGLDVILELSTVKTDKRGRPLAPPVIREVRVFSVGDPEPLEEPHPYFPERHEFEPRPKERPKHGDQGGR